MIDFFVSCYLLEKIIRIICLNEQIALINLKKNIIKHTLCLVSAPTCFGNKVPSSGSLIIRKDRNSKTYFKC